MLTVCFACSIYRIDCSENCKARKQLLDNECKQLRRDLATSDELKKTNEQQKRNLEQEVCQGRWLFVDSYFIGELIVYTLCSPCVNGSSGS